MKQTITKAEKKPISLWTGGVLQHAAGQSLFNHKLPLMTSPSRPPLLQTKLRIGQPNDQYEQEADRIADAIVSGGLIPKSISTISTRRLQRLRREPEKSTEDKLEELLEKLGEAALETPQFKQILDRVEDDPLYKSGKEFTGTLPGVFSIGTLTAGLGAVVAGALIDASEELPMQIPEIPIGGGHSVKLTINGPLDNLDDWSIAYTLKLDAAEEEKPVVNKGGAIRSDIARLLEQERKIRATTRKVSGSPETLTERAKRLFEEANAGLYPRAPINLDSMRLGEQKRPKHALQLTPPTPSFGYQPQSPLIGKDLRLRLLEKRKKKDEETAMQRKAERDVASSYAPQQVHDSLANPGQPLDPNTRSFMENRFGHDFSRVRVHTNASAAASARAVHATAYTVGHDIVFGSGRFSPQTHEGKRLIAHELAHVVQQSEREGISIGLANEKAGLPRNYAASDDNEVVHAIDTRAITLGQNIVCGSGNSQASLYYQTSGILQRQPEKGIQSRRQHSEAVLRTMGRFPSRALYDWLRLDQSERDMVLWKIVDLYGLAFATQFLEYAYRRRKPEFVVQSIQYSSDTPKLLADQGYHYAGDQGGIPKWVHPSGYEVWISPPPQRKKKDEYEDTPFERRCVNPCLLDTENEAECHKCCDRIPKTDRCCKSACNIGCSTCVVFD